MASIVHIIEDSDPQDKSNFLLPVIVLSQSQFFYSLPVLFSSALYVEVCIADIPALEGFTLYDQNYNHFCCVARIHKADQQTC